MSSRPPRLGTRDGRPAEGLVMFGYRGKRRQQTAIGQATRSLPPGAKQSSESLGAERVSVKVCRQDGFGVCC